MTGSFHDDDANVVEEVGVPSRDIRGAEIVEFRGEFSACGSTPDNLHDDDDDGDRDY